MGKGRKVMIIKIPPSIPKPRVPHMPTKVHKTKKIYDRKRQKREWQKEIKNYIGKR